MTGRNRERETEGVTETERDTENDKERDRERQKRHRERHIMIDRETHRMRQVLRGDQITFPQARHW